MSRLFRAQGLPRRSELRRKKSLRARKAMVRRNAKRKRERYEREFGDKAEYIRNLPCCACHAEAPSEPHHHPSRGAGGTSQDLVPLCPSCHHAFHQGGAITFQKRWGVDLKAKAALYEEYFRRSPQDLGF